MENLIIRELILLLFGCVAAGGVASTPLLEHHKQPVQAVIAVLTLIAMAHAAGMI